MSGMLLAGREVFLTGAAGAIGQAITTLFRAEGATVHGVDLVSGEGIAPCDVTDEIQVAQVVERLSESRALTDVVHAAGILSVGPIAATSIAEVRRVLEVNLLSSFVLARACVPFMTTPSSFTVLASQAAARGSANWGAYSASKGGVRNFVESLAKETGPAGIRVNGVCPSSVESPMMDAAMATVAEVTGESVDEQRRRYASANPLRRMATPLDVARACLFLASELASFVNGALINVDGGEDA